MKHCGILIAFKSAVCLELINRAFVTFVVVTIERFHKKLMHANSIKAEKKKEKEL